MTSLPSGVEDDPTRAFRDAIPRRFRLEMHPTLVANLRTALDKSWTLDELIAEAQRDIPPTHVAPGRLAAYRIAKAAEFGPPGGPRVKRAALPEPCGHCDGSPGRWMETLDGDRVIHCPNCWVAV